MNPAQLNGYDLTRRWWDWCFRNQGHYTPTHVALYSWLVESNNRAGWSQQFEMAPQYAMTAIGVRAYNTYVSVLTDLIAWGFVGIIQKGTNQYTPWMVTLGTNDEALLTLTFSASPVALSKFNKALDKAIDKAKSALSNFDKALDKALDKAIDKAREPITINNKQENFKPTNKTLSARAFCASVEKSDAVGVNFDTAAGEPDTATPPTPHVAARPLPPPEVIVGSPEKTKKEAKPLNVPFEVWWAAYEKKIDRADCEKKWAQLTNSQREAALKHTGLYVLSTPDIQFRRHPKTYLNKRSWENEIIEGVTPQPVNSYGKSATNNHPTTTEFANTIDALAEWKYGKRGA